MSSTAGPAAEAELLADVAVAAGDQRAAAVLYDAYAHALYGYGLQRLRDAEVAEILALPLGTVKSRTYYALRAFRLTCEEMGVTP